MTVDTASQEQPGPGGAGVPTIDIGLRLLDHQMTGREDELVGNVDNLVLEEVDGYLAVTGIVVGPAGLGPRLKGRLGRWLTSIWARLRPEGHPQEVVVPLDHVTRIGATVALDEVGQELVAMGSALEAWLRQYVVGRIPGATGGPDRLAHEALGPTSAGATGPAAGRPPDSRLVSELIGAQVVDHDGRRMGEVLDVTSAVPARGSRRIGPLVLVGLTVGRRRLGAELGYAVRPGERVPGPWLLAALLQWWHRGNRRVAMDDVELVDWVAGTVTLRDPGLQGG